MSRIPGGLPAKELSKGVKKSIHCAVCYDALKTGRGKQAPYSNKNGCTDTWEGLRTVAFWAKSVDTSIFFEPIAIVAEMGMEMLGGAQ